MHYKPFSTPPPYSKYTHINLHDLKEDVNKKLLELGSEWILRCRPDGRFTSIWSKNINTGQDIEMIFDYEVDEAYAYLLGYATALINLKIDGLPVTFDNSPAESQRRKKFLGIF
ncbi:hypothetical protein [Pedobacter sp. BMA]|uniref:hypothetical protein n=1 Tax=Pedobacter sp. BMA TaxID=1663685 RepID=UPI00064B20C0|nr:hypothetical protein [Pedobacter sp. BMA]KLT66473.1 hypothetical protein AB669_04595 [Pedobacter sp. BMA]